MRSCIERSTRGQHGAVAHAGVEDAHRRRPRLEQAQLEVDPLGDDPLLGTGADEEEVLLPVVVEAKAPAWPARAAGSADVAMPAAPVASCAADSWPRRAMKARTRSTVCVVTRPPKRSRGTNLPSLTTRRPKVDSAIPAARQKLAISCSSASFPARRRALAGWARRLVSRGAGAGWGCIRRDGRPSSSHLQPMGRKWDTSH
jgi:hypothetical protein